MLMPSQCCRCQWRYEHHFQMKPGSQASFHLAGKSYSSYLDQTCIKELRALPLALTNRGSLATADPSRKVLADA